MLHDVLFIAAALIVTWLLTPLAIRVGRRIGMVDDPDGPLKIHTDPTPRSGGIALALTLILLQTASEFTTRPLLSNAEFSVAMMLCALGVWDDRRPRSAQLRLLLQAVIYAVGFVAGFRLHWMSAPWLDFMIGLGLFIVVVNAVNFYDGMDGLLSLTGAVALGMWGFLALEFGLVAVPFFVAAAMFLGFLPRNWHPAGVFLGDGGSFLIGFFFFLVFARTVPTGLEPAAGMWVAAVPLCDAIAATTDRLLRRGDVWAGDRDHVYDLLARRGWGAPRVAMFLALAAASTARLSGPIAMAPVKSQWISTVALYLALTLIILMMRARLGERRRSR